MVKEDIASIWFEQIKNGDIIAFEKFFKHYYKKLCVFAEDYVREKAIAEEIVSEVFYKIWENRELIQVRSSVTAYLFKSVHNNSLKHLEHLKTLKKYEEYAVNMMKNADLLLPQSDGYPLANIISQENLSKIDEAINALPAQCKEVFCLCRFENLSYEETAEKLGISINTVRTQILRAMAKLRESLAEFLPVGLVAVFLQLFP
jgi:RNA polymerase sigma-70 factor, ECF subfamily